MIRSRRHKNKRAFGSRRSERSAQATSAPKSSPALNGSRPRTAAGASAGSVKLDQSVVLIGLMGTGKTTIGRRLARAIGVGFVDSDHEIEKAAQMSVSDIFESYGEQEFRAVERRVINRLIAGRPKVIATGGGAFMNDETRQLIKDNALTFWLNADIDVLVERTSRRDTRPLLRDGDPGEILTRLAAERNPIYAQSTLMVKSSEGPHENVVTGMVKQLRDYFKAQKAERNKKNENNESVSNRSKQTSRHSNHKKNKRHGQNESPESNESLKNAESQKRAEKTAPTPSPEGGHHNG